MPPPPEYAVVPPNWSLASTTMTDSPSRAAVYAPTSPPPGPATMTSGSSCHTRLAGLKPASRCAERSRLVDDPAIEIEDGIGDDGAGGHRRNSADRSRGGPVPVRPRLALPG